MSEEDPHMPKWALDPLLTESSPLQTGRGTEGHGAIDGVDEPDSEADYDSDFSDEDMARYSGVRTVRRGCLLDSLLLLNAITVIAALGVGVAQGMVLGYHKDLSPESVAVRCYNILFCMLIIMAELEWTTTVREMFVLHSWIPRGVVYSFVGVLVLEEEDEKGLDLGGFGLYITIIAWIMVGIGALYFLLGLCCVKRIRDKKMARHKTLVAHAEMQAAMRRDHDAIA
ncbi:unnamed protein product [Ectocarpus sp. 12 AP-2014]